MPVAFSEMLALVLLFHTMSPKFSDPVLVMVALPILKTASSLEVGTLCVLQLFLSSRSPDPK